jgi:hypothetical protein
MYVGSWSICGRLRGEGSLSGLLRNLFGVLCRFIVGLMGIDWGDMFGLLRSIKVSICGSECDINNNYLTTINLRKNV